VRFAGGDEIETDVLLACIGVKARTSFLHGSTIGVNEGIVVDTRMKTNIPNIFAAGDVAEARDFFSGRNRVNPILPNAASQGRVAGSNMADEACEYEGSLAMNAFNFFEHLANSIGKVTADEGDQVLKDMRNGSYARLVFTGDRFTGASFLDVDVDAGVIRHLIRKKIQIGKQKEMLLKAPREVGFWLMNEAEKKETLSKEE
jgi:phenylglyoxylate dehydrogenase epsilon subunit